MSSTVTTTAAGVEAPVNRLATDHRQLRGGLEPNLGGRRLRGLACPSAVIGWAAGSIVPSGVGVWVGVGCSVSVGVGVGVTVAVGSGVSVAVGVGVAVGATPTTTVASKQPGMVQCSLAPLQYWAPW